MEGISLRELIRMHEGLEDDHKDLTKYSHELGHKVIGFEQVIPLMREDIKIHYKQIDSLRRFMWLTIGAVMIVNVLIPVLDKLGRVFK